MANKRFMNDEFFDFSSLEKQIETIKQNELRENASQQSNIQQHESEIKNENLMNLLESQLTILIDIQYLLTEIEKNTRAKKRSFFK